ncbi:hypothetical protein LCGC14_1249660 [marine sediment metagenome]|uniref:Uncharacterized protein n=1 Tax=marine sediment metagenome TaxID=412755 RepID=A0A0F9P7F5_9ZZZZ
MMFWLIIFIALWLVILPRLINRGRSTPGEFNRLARKIETEENKGNIEQLVVFHKQRLEAGANSQDSLERMMKDLEKLGEIEEESSKHS